MRLAYLWQQAAELPDYEPPEENPLHCPECGSTNVSRCDCLACDGYGYIEAYGGAAIFPCDVCGETGSDDEDYECHACGEIWSDEEIDE